MSAEYTERLSDDSPTESKENLLSPTDDSEASVRDLPTEANGTVAFSQSTSSADSKLLSLALPSDLQETVGISDPASLSDVDPPTQANGTVTFSQATKDLESPPPADHRETTTKELLLQQRKVSTYQKVMNMTINCINI